MSDKKTPTVVLASPHFWAHGELRLVGNEVIKFRGCYRRLRVSERRLMNARLAAHRIPDEALERQLRAAAWLPQEWADKVKSATAETLPAVLAAFRLHDAEFLGLVLVDWDLTDKQGAAVPYASRELVFDEWDGLEAAFCSAFYGAERAEDPEKNSATPSAGI